MITHRLLGFVIWRDALRWFGSSTVARLSGCVCPSDYDEFESLWNFPKSVFSHSLKSIAVLFPLDGILSVNACWWNQSLIFVDLSGITP
ncbi:hypothetical protein ACJRO7_004106, partial [Eucalyptus globulus]